MSGSLSPKASKPKDGPERSIGFEKFDDEDQKVGPEKQDQRFLDIYKSFLLSYLKAVSVGKYRTSLYYKGGETYSSSIGGLITILLAIVMIPISLNLMMGCINRTNWISTEE